ncbi:MAG: hypothetical protein ABIL09_16585 [Gemmatimonadota bacterium]
MSDAMENERAGTWKSIKRSLREGAAQVMDRAEELTQLGRARLDIAATKARLGRLHAELGAEVYRLIQSGAGTSVADSSEVRGLCEQIHDAEAALRHGEAALASLRTEVASEGPQ